MSGTEKGAQDVVRSVHKDPAHEAVIVELAGEVDLHCAGELRGVLLEQLKATPTRLVISLSEVSFMDSSGLATLVEALQVSKRHGASLTLVGLQPRVRSIFEISRLIGIFSVCDSLEEALES